VIYAPAYKTNIEVSFSSFTLVRNYLFIGSNVHH